MIFGRREFEYKWKRSFSADRIVSFRISAGDRPIRNFEFEGNIVKGYNRINISRDGWMGSDQSCFEEGFFEEQIVHMPDRQTEDIHKLLQAIPFERWKSADHIMELHETKAEGFCLTEFFECVFADGQRYRCYPGEEPPELFEVLFYCMCGLCPLPRLQIPEPEEGDRSAEKTEEPFGVACPNCGAVVANTADFCGMCGEKLKAHDRLERKGEFDFQATVGQCKACGEWIPMYYRFCSKCGSRTRRS